MTAVMRAMSIAPITGPRLIRIGIVRGGRVIEERVIKDRSTVTVGSSETSTFIVSARGLTPEFPIFERVGNDYCLNIVDGMKGRIALAGEITDLQNVHARQVRLTEESRGKVVLGETTLLFQFVAAPPPQPRPQLPLAVKGGLASHNDWALTFIAAFSFLFHFGILGAMYSDWSDPIVDDGRGVAGLVDLVAHIPLPLVEIPEEATSNPTLPPVPTPAPKTPTETAHQAPGPVAPRGPHGPTQPTERTSNDAAAKLAARGEAMQMQILAGLNEGPAVKGALDKSTVPGIDLSRAAEQNSAVERGSGDLKTASGGPITASNKGGLSVLGGPLRTEGPTVAGKETAVAGPTAVAQVGTTVASMPVPNADGTVAALRNRFRSCYQTGLLTDSTMSGKVVISAKVGPNGEVSSSDIASISGLSPAVGQCIAGVVKRATFSAPGGGGATVQIPVTFVQSK